ncbi:MULTISPECIES: phosphotransferase [unclassified Streptomyces]|uniref:phosphotransferase n=1 Tax=unclassified Streptomyces TaxID=2593676 RepID=UPI002DD7A14C|nr:phosphotransferase [Streptomyces sp. NBC_01795]WSA93874.1 aminoglycoside phosphotransferase family protein [Streptomyces sp. NBC_01795]WSS42298.1 aminoglycoside phosphotransferase family protein [Streptomyces sp. NBC_01187]
MTSTALHKATEVGSVHGPLRGYHREWYVVSPAADFPGTGRVKVGEPREDALWFDRRCFASEDALLTELARRALPRIPPVYRLGEGPSLHGFIEGTPLDALAPAGTPVAAGHLGQIMEMFTHLSAVRPDGFSVPRLCRAEDRPVDGDSAGFLRSLIRFTRERAYRRHLPRYGRLFNQLGLPRGALGPRSPLAAAAAALTPRPFSLLHGDLHRANFIVDDAGGLWTIDWELAMLGDPLYDLATHLYLMNYPAGQQREVIRRWQALMSRALPGSTAGTEEDLPRYLAYKRAQSVYTDIVRHASALHSASSAQVRRERLRASAKDVHQVLTRGAEALGLREVPTPAEVEDAYGAFGAVRPVRG